MARPKVGSNLTMHFKNVVLKCTLHSLKPNWLYHRSYSTEILKDKRAGLVEPRGQVFFTGYHLLDLSLNQQHLHIFSYDTDSHSLCNTLRYSRSSDKLKGERNHWIRNSSGFERSEKQVGNNKNHFLLKSIYNSWNKEKQCIHTTP